MLVTGCVSCDSKYNLLVAVLLVQLRQQVLEEERLKREQEEEEAKAQV